MNSVSGIARSSCVPRETNPWPLIRTSCGTLTISNDDPATSLISASINLLRTNSSIGSVAPTCINDPDSETFGLINVICWLLINAGTAREILSFLSKVCAIFLFFLIIS